MAYVVGVVEVLERYTVTVNGRELRKSRWYEDDSGIPWEDLQAGQTYTFGLDKSGEWVKSVRPAREGSKATQSKPALTAVQGQSARPPQGRNDERISRQWAIYASIELLGKGLNLADVVNMANSVLAYASSPTSDSVAKEMKPAKAPEQDSLEVKLKELANKLGWLENGVLASEQGAAFLAKIGSQGLLVPKHRLAEATLKMEDILNSKAFVGPNGEYIRIPQTPREVASA